MKTLTVILACFALTISPSQASPPGQPLDCSDWVFLEPGLSCTTTIPYPCPDIGICNQYPGDVSIVDNEGRVIALRKVNLGSGCPPLVNRWRIEIIRIQENGTSNVLGYIEDRCVDPNTSDTVEYSGMYFYPGGGSLGVAFSNRSVAMPTSNERYPWGIQRMKVTGLTTLFEVLQTYTPAANAFQFRVPYMPEGLASASRFDTYWGRVSDLPDFTQAQPMACGYPSDHQPQVGEYITVSDTSPQPAAGQAHYIVTAASDGVQRRFGRQRVGPSLTGRDPALLPSCP